MSDKDKVKILFITDNFPPEVNAPATRTYEHCREWVKLGADVTVITCFPNFPTGKVFKGYKNKIWQRENIDGIEVIRVWSYITENKGFFKRTLDYFSFAITSFFAGLFIKSDVIIATSPQFFTTWSAFALSKIKKIPWIFELRDLWPESIKEVGIVENEKIIKFLEKIELGLYEDTDLIISVTESFKKNLINRGISKDKIKVVYNGVDLNFFYPRLKDKNLLKLLNLENKFIIGYIGTHGLAHKLDFILKSAKDINDKDIHFLFIGDGAEKENLINLSKKLNLNNVTFLNSVRKEDVPKYLSIIDVSLVPLKKSELFKTVIPSKIFESCAMKKPILLGVEGEAQNIISKYNAGISYKPENKLDFIKKINLLKNDKYLYKKLQDGCETLAKNFNRKELAKEMFLYIKGLRNKL